ncbi:hypothetical protein Thermo_00596 [Thermoplasmatales archaeon]|nr:hypothetical protein Thermo_00596 [Thermoplasmatales archaeon]
MDKDMRVFFSLYIILAVIGVVGILNWGGYLKTDWMPSTLTLITLESAGILATTLVMVVFKTHSNARDRI